MSIEFEDNRVRVKQALFDASEVFLHEAGGELQSRTRRNSRVDTGQTKGSYEYKIDAGSAEQTCQIGSNLENAIWEEFGTGEYALHGDGRKTAWTYKDRKGKWHRTSGKRPSRALNNAFASSKGKLKSRLEKMLKEL